MIKKYVYGDPFFTDAVVKDIEKSEDKLPYFDVKDGVFTYALSEDDIVYGLGEQIRGINKRGWQYVSWNYDNPNHHEDTRSLYGSHNFIIICGKQTFGAFFDYAGRMEFDIGYTKRSLMQIKPEKNDIAVYIITGENEKDIVKQFRQLIGRSYIPPFWAFGYGQSRWGYRNEQAYPDAFKANVKMPPMGHYGDVEKEIGRVCVQLASPDFKYMSGETLTLEGAMGQRP